MKVGDLIQKLSMLAPELDVICYTEDAKIIKDSSRFLLLDIKDVTSICGETMRLDDGTPYLKLGKGPNSVCLATIEVIADF